MSGMQHGSPSVHVFVGSYVYPRLQGSIGIHVPPAGVHEAPQQELQTSHVSNITSTRIEICMTKKQICASCEEPVGDDAYFGEIKTHYEGKPLCESCFYDGDPLATIFYGKDMEPHYITQARNETEGDYQANWHSTDPWRGYYELSSEKYMNIFSDSILAGHESEEMLKTLNDKLMEDFDNRQVDYTRSFTRTSNVFSTGYDIWVRKQPEQILIAHFSLERIKKEVDYENPSLRIQTILVGYERWEKLNNSLVLRLFFVLGFPLLLFL
jgi:hypothetical protein